MPKTDKELAVELMGDYLRAIYSQEHIRAMDATRINALLQACYAAVKSLPDD